MNDWRELKIMVKALADVARLTIVYHLAHRDEVTVSELTGILGLSQPLVSWHLRKLRRAGIIHTGPLFHGPEPLPLLSATFRDAHRSLCPA